MVGNLWTYGRRILVEGEIPLIVYHSTRSKLRVAVADVPGPMVKSVFSFVTETNNDDGLPHTLEHLVFMGSAKYPYKGVLDIIANRCLASGTNAWTEQDHTAYTLATVGSQGFLKVLPVYMDHVLSPTLTDSQFITEVHHINGEGEDAGVVYSEMQDHESDMDEIVSRTRKELFYPPGNSYRVQTGGRLEPLRSSCCNEKVRKFHEQFYHLNNMFITVCGIIDHGKLLETIAGVEDSMLTRIPASFPRPFTSTFPLLKSPKECVIECPSDDECRGVVQISWVGPKASDLYTSVALEILFEYLQDTAVAPLQRDFIQLADPFASSVFFCLSEQSTSEIVLFFSGVPVEKLETIKNRLFEKTLNGHRDEKVFDMERLGFIINKAVLKRYAKLETTGPSQIFHSLIGYQLYGDDEKDLELRLNEVTTLKGLASEPALFWSELLRTYLSPNCVTVVGKPSGAKVMEYARQVYA
ncbi:hypothetical protein AB6A40_005935 [Gnathostoma spinigerum]|uniref:Uncharacterized protein n=1 Tax=Gnathostoma spinigerum TaxID=75299 RepID=A0ABD6EP67_9BILA